MRQEPSVGSTVRLIAWLARATVIQLLAGVDLLAPWDLIVGRVKLYRKSHDQIGRYRMGLGEKTASHIIYGVSLT